jgi:hypothetical protein
MDEFSGSGDWTRRESRCGGVGRLRGRGKGTGRVGFVSGFCFFFFFFFYL